MAETLFFDFHRQHNIAVRVARIFNTFGPGMHPYGEVLHAWYSFSFFFSHTFTFQLLGQAVVTGFVPSSPPVLAFDFYRA